MWLTWKKIAILRATASTILMMHVAASQVGACVPNCWCDALCCECLSLHRSLDSLAVSSQFETSTLLAERATLCTQNCIAPAGIRGKIISLPTISHAFAPLHFRPSVLVFFNSMADFPEKKNPLLGVEFRVPSLLSFPSVVLLAAV